MKTLSGEMMKQIRRLLAGIVCGLLIISTQLGKTWNVLKHFFFFFFFFSVLFDAFICIYKMHFAAKFQPCSFVKFVNI